MKNLVITIDGPAAAGKTTAAMGISKKMGLTYVNTGALYRALAIGLDGQEPMEDLLHTLSVELDGDRVLLNGCDVTEQTKTEACGEAASVVSAIPMVRDYLFSIQRKFVERGNCILEGRDTGSVIAPDADVRFYLDANLGVRAARRGCPATDLQKRDERDMSRPVSPLCFVDGMIRVDNSHLSIDETVNFLVSQIRKVTAKQVGKDFLDIRSDVFSVIEQALARAGYRIVDGYDDTVIVRDPRNSIDFSVILREEDAE